MENIQRQILSEIKEMSASLISQLNILQSRIHDLELIINEDVKDAGDAVIDIAEDVDAGEAVVDIAEDSAVDAVVEIDDPEDVVDGVDAGDAVVDIVNDVEPVVEIDNPEDAEDAEAVEDVVDGVEPVVEIDNPEDAEAVEDVVDGVEDAEAVEDVVDGTEAVVDIAADELSKDSVKQEVSLDEKESTTTREPHHVKMAVIDALAEHQAWKTDMAGSQVRDIRSAISLNDRLFFINSLFERDAVLFQNTICALNNMTSLDEAIQYLSQNHSNWDFESEAVYRFMMAVRRKIR